MYTVVSSSGRELGSFQKLIQAFVFLEELIAAGWDRVGIRDNRTTDEAQRWPIVGVRPPPCPK